MFWINVIIIIVIIFDIVSLSLTTLWQNGFHWANWSYWCTRSYWSTWSYWRSTAYIAFMLVLNISNWCLGGLSVSVLKVLVHYSHHEALSRSVWILRFVVNSISLSLSPNLSGSRSIRQAGHSTTLWHSIQSKWTVKLTLAIHEIVSILSSSTALSIQSFMRHELLLKNHTCLKY